MAGALMAALAAHAWAQPSGGKTSDSAKTGYCDRVCSGGAEC